MGFYRQPVPMNIGPVPEWHQQFRHRQSRIAGTGILIVAVVSLLPAGSFQKFSVDADVMKLIWMKAPELLKQRVITGQFFR